MTKTYNQKGCSHQDSLDVDIQIEWEGDTKVVGVGEHLASQARPLLGNLAHLGLAIHRQHVELYVATQCETTYRSLDLQHSLASAIAHRELGIANRPILGDTSQQLTTSAVNLDLLQEAWAATTAATIRTIDCHDLVTHIVHDQHVEWTTGTQTVASAKVILCQ